jgi:hypothetical protein
MNKEYKLCQLTGWRQITCFYLGEMDQHALVQVRDSLINQA